MTAEHCKYLFRQALRYVTGEDACSTPHAIECASRHTEAELRELLTEGNNDYDKAS